MDVAEVCDDDWSRSPTCFLPEHSPAVGEYSAALFLVPDDPVLTPQLHVGRAHNLDGQERHASAWNDALMALRTQGAARAGGGGGLMTQLQTAHPVRRRGPMRVEPHVRERVLVRGY